jgi:hypothetical protein
MINKKSSVKTTVKDFASDKVELNEEMKDIKIGEIDLREGSTLVIKKTNYNGEDRIDFRVWLNTAKYKGPTKQGFVVRMDKLDEFIGIVDNIKKKLG